MTVDRLPNGLYHLTCHRSKSQGLYTRDGRMLSGSLWLAPQTAIRYIQENDPR